MAPGGREKELKEERKKEPLGLETNEGFGKIGKVFGPNIGP